MVEYRQIPPRGGANSGLLFHSAIRERNDLPSMTSSTAVLRAGASIGCTKLDPQVVKSTIEGQIRAFDVSNHLQVKFSSHGTSVFVEVKAPLRLTFFDTLPFDPVVVSATARLDYREPG